MGTIDQSAKQISNSLKTHREFEIVAIFRCWMKITLAVRVHTQAFWIVHGSIGVCTVPLSLRGSLGSPFKVREALWRQHDRFDAKVKAPFTKVRFFKRFSPILGDGVTLGSFISILVLLFSTV